MPKKKPLPSFEAVDDINPWLLAYQKVTVYELQPGETTIRKFMADCGIDTYYKAKEAMTKLVKEGLAVEVCKRTIKQDGYKPAVVNVYRLADAETEGGKCGVCGSKLDIVRPGKYQCPKCE